MPHGHHMRFRHLFMHTDGSMTGWFGDPEHYDRFATRMERALRSRSDRRRAVVSEQCNAGRPVVEPLGVRADDIPVNAADPAFDPTFRQLVDLSAVDGFAGPTETVQYLSAVRLFHPGTPRAIVATKAIIAARTEQYQQLTAARGENMRVFDDRAAALAWLSTVLVALDQATRTSDVTTVALDGLIALTYLGLIMAMLVPVIEPPTMPTWKAVYLMSWK